MARPRHRRHSSEIIATCREMNVLGMNRGSSGNVSLRLPDNAGRLLITPSGIPYDRMTPAQIVEMDFDGGYWGEVPPSSEWRLHAEIYRRHSEAGAVVHTHADFCTVLACLHLEIPAFHYMIALAGGPTIRCAGYAPFGTQALADAMLAALDGRNACLLANHGMICFGPSLDGTLALAVEVETLARQYWHVRLAGTPVLLSDEHMGSMVERFATYGRPSAGPPSRLGTRRFDSEGIA